MEEGSFPVGRASSVLALQTRKTQDRRLIVFVCLNGFEILAQILDAMADGGLVVVIQVLKDWSPHWHL